MATSSVTLDSSIALESSLTLYPSPSSPEHHPKIDNVERMEMANPHTVQNTTNGELSKVVSNGEIGMEDTLAKNKLEIVNGDLNMEDTLAKDDHGLKDMMKRIPLRWFILSIVLVIVWVMLLLPIIYFHTAIVSLIATPSVPTIHSS